MINIAVQALAVVGFLLLVSLCYRLLSFIWFYRLRRTSVQQYLHDDSSAYALITGASDGIGRAVAQELYDKGFNLIIHGRNEDKVRGVAEDLRARGSQDVQYFIADAENSGHDFAQLIKPFKRLNVTLVVHNVGGTIMSRERIDGLSEADLQSIVTRNAFFPLFLTRTLLPQLRLSAISGPVLVQFVGSQTADIAPPRLPVYSASKAFLRALARGLDNDERFWGAPTGVRFAYLALGEVRTHTHDSAHSAASPSAECLAQALVARTGCGRRAYTPYMWHAILQWLLGFLPETTVDDYAAEAMAEVFARRKKAA